MHTRTVSPESCHPILSIFSFYAHYRHSGQANVSFRVPSAGWRLLNGAALTSWVGGRVLSCSKTTDLAATAGAVTANKQNANFSLKNIFHRCQTQPSRCLQLIGMRSAQTFSNTCRNVIGLTTLPISNYFHFDHFVSIPYTQSCDTRSNSDQVGCRLRFPRCCVQEKYLGWYGTGVTTFHLLWTQDSSKQRAMFAGILRQLFSSLPKESKEM